MAGLRGSRQGRSRVNASANQRMKLTGAAILVSRGMKVLGGGPAAYPYRSAAEGFGVVEANRMRLGRFEFVIDFGSFRRITACWSGPGWDFNFSGACVNEDPAEPTFPEGRIGVYCDAAPLPFAKAADYTGVVVDLPGFYDEASGEPYFAVYVGESYEVSDARLRFAARDGGRYLIELS